MSNALNAITSESVAVSNRAIDATLTITGTKDLTGEGQKQVLLSLTTKDANITAMSTFADLGCTSLVITAYKNGTVSTNPLEETPLFTRTFHGTHLNKAAISLEVTHEETVGSDSEFQAGTNYVFDVRFMKTSAITLLRGVHTFHDAPELTTTTDGSTVTNYNFIANVSANGIGLTVATHADAPVLNEVFVEIIKLSDTPGVTEADRDSNGNIIVYSLQKYEAATGGAFEAGAGAQVIRANELATLPNAGNDANGNPHTLTSGSSYNMNVIFVTNGGTSNKHRVTPDSSTNTSLLLSSAPSAFKQTFIDQQKTNTDVTNNTNKNTLDASILQVLEITAISGSEIIDKVSTQIKFGDNTKTFASHDDYATTGDKAIHFETDFVTSLSQGAGADEITRKFIAIRYTKASAASSPTITGTQLADDDDDVSANYPTIASGADNFQDRLFPQVCTETVTMFNNKHMGISSSTDSTFGTGEGVDATIKVIYVQLTELDFGMLIGNVNTTISNSSTTLNSAAVNKFVYRTDATATGTLVESDPASTTSFTTVKMDLPTDQNITTQLASGTLQVTQNELNADETQQSFSLQSTTDLLAAFVDTTIVDFVQLTLDDNSATGNNRFKSFTLDTSTATGRPTAVNFLKGTHALTLTNGTDFGATANSTTADNYGVLPESSNNIPLTSAGYKPYSTLQSIAFASASLVENVHVVVHLKGYNYGAQLFSGNMSLRYELGSLINNGTGNIVDYTDPNNDENGDDAVSIYGGTMGGGVTDPGKLSRASYENTITAQSAGKAALVAGTVTATAFPAMGRTPLKATVTATQASKAVLPNSGNGAAFTLTITENFEFDNDFSFTDVPGANGKLALYDLTVTDNRPSTATIILNGETSESQTFIINLTGYQTISDANGDDASSDFTTTTASGTTQGVYSVTIENGRTLGGQTVAFSPGDRLEVFVALGNATYGTSPSAYGSDNTGTTDLTRFDTVGNDGDRLPVTTNNFLDKDAANATDNTVNGGLGNKFIDVFGINADRSAGPTVGEPTVSLGAENKGNDLGATGRFIFNVVANASDIDQLIDYTQLEVKLTVTPPTGGSTTTTHTFGTFGNALATDLSENEGGITKTNKQNYVVTFNSGETIGGASATFNGGDTVSAKATLRTDYDRNGTESTSSTDDRTIRTNATLKNAASFGSAFLTQNKALFDVDLIDKNTLKLAPYYFNHGVSNVNTWDDIITLNGNSVGDLALEILVRYERENNGFNTFDADQDEVPAFAESVTIVDGDNFAALADTDVITLTLQASQVNKLKVRLPSDAANHGIVRLMVTIRLTTVYADGIAVNDIQPATFTPYLEKLALNSVEAVSASEDTLTWKAKFTPEAYKTNLSSVKMELAIQKNNIASHTLHLHDVTSNNSAIQVTDVTVERTTNEGDDGNPVSYTSSDTPTDGAEAFVTFQTDLSGKPALRGSYLVPKFTVNSTASNNNYSDQGTDKDFTSHDNNTQPHNVADADFTTRAAQKLAARDSAQVVSNPIADANGLTYFSMVPNGNTSGVILTVDNVGTKELGLGHIANQADQTNAIGKHINNNTFNAVFGVNVTLTVGDDETTFLVGGLHNLTITPTATTVGNVLDALNAMPIFPSTMLLPGPANGGTAATAAWSLSNVVFDNGTGALTSTTVPLNANATIELQFEGVKSATSKVSYVAVTYVSGTNGGVSTTENGDNFIVLSLTNDADNAQPLPTLVAPAGTTDAIFAMSGITNTTGTVSSLVTTEGVTIA